MCFACSSCSFNHLLFLLWLVAVRWPALLWATLLSLQPVNPFTACKWHPCSIWKNWFSLTLRTFPPPRRTSYSVHPPHKHSLSWRDESCPLLEMSSALGCMVFVNRKLYQSVGFLVRESHFLEHHKKYISVYGSLGYTFKSLEESCCFLLSSVKVLKRSLPSPPGSVSSTHGPGPTLPGPGLLPYASALGTWDPGAGWLTLRHPGSLGARPQGRGELDRMSRGKRVKEILAGGKSWRKN